MKAQKNTGFRAASSVGRGNEEPVHWIMYRTPVLGPLAQLVEHRPFKACVPGSSPGRLTGVVRGRPGLCRLPSH